MTSSKTLNLKSMASISKLDQYLIDAKTIEETSLLMLCIEFINGKLSR